MGRGAHGVRWGRFDHGSVQLGARVKGERVHPHLVDLGLRLQAVGHNHWSGGGGGARVTGGITGYWDIPWPGRQGKEGTGDILLNIGRFDGLAPTPPTAPEALCGGIGGGGVVPRGGVGGGA